jgi:hypothetical protein
MGDEATKQCYLVNDGTQTHVVWATDGWIDEDGLLFEVDGRAVAHFRQWAWWKYEGTDGKPDAATGEGECPR